MKTFAARQLKAALEFAAAGGQAVHLHRIVFDGSPLCFRRAVARGESVAHLFDQDVERLERTARAAGVRTVVIERRGTPRQHIDLCGRPLRKVLTAAGGPLFMETDDGKKEDGGGRGGGTDSLHRG